MSWMRSAQVLSVAILIASVLGCQGKDKPSAQKAPERPANPRAANAQLEQEALAAVQKVSELVGQGQVDEAKSLLTDTLTRYRGTMVAAQAQSIQGELAVIGKSAPTKWGIEKWFQGQNQIDLASDKPTVVVFWETWCPHCRDEVPKLQALYSSYKDKGLQLIAVTQVNHSATEQMVKDFIASNNLTYPIAKEDGSLSSYFNVRGIPAAAVVKGGKVVWRGHPMRLKDDVLKNWL